MKYKNIFVKGCTLNWTEEVFEIKRFKSIVPWTYVLEEVNEEVISRTYYEGELQNANQTEYRVEKVIKKKGDKFNVK